MGANLINDKQGKRLIDEHLVRYIIEHEMLGGDV